MARWRLTAPHYLNVPGTEWEYKETDRTSGKQARKVFPVPLLLDTNNPGDFNYPGDIVVCYEGKGESRDITFLGKPTPDMEPLDDEARQISDSLSPNWTHPIESLPANNFSQSLIASFEKQMAESMSKTPISNTSAKGIDPAEFKKLQDQVFALMERNIELEAKAEHKASRRA